MSEKFDFRGALAAAAAQYGWESEWTDTGELSQPLSAWLEAANRILDQGEPTFERRS